jgi:glycosyltransferase involved in cell wall biosynthesis
VSARLSILKAATREHLTSDLGPLGGPLAMGAFLAARAAAAGPATLRPRGYKTLMRLHSGAFSGVVDRWIAGEIQKAMQAERAGQATGLWACFDQTIQQAVHTLRAGSRRDPKHLIGTRILVAKAARGRERGVLVVDYSYVFPLMAGFFDLAAIADRYSIVLEPSWADVCTPDILLYSRLARPVFVQTIEPRDHEFLGTLRTNLEIVPLAANWWVDHRAVTATVATRDIDVIMVAAWADIKRHWRVFKALADLRRRGHRLKVALAGYKYDRTRGEIEALAGHFGIRDQVETYERISQAEVFALLARSKVHVLWSRRECANRAIIEAMLADVPVIVREGLTFGFHYPYINDLTGRFVRERDLGDAILEMIERRTSYQPRAWVLDHMTCAHATAALESQLRHHAESHGEPWSEGLVVRTSTLDTQKYWNPEDRDRFENDYRFLENAIRASHG